MKLSTPNSNDWQISNLKLGIVCPMANEIANAEKFVFQVLEFCNCEGFNSVIFFAILDNASKDGTLELLQNLQKKKIQLQVVFAQENRHVVDAYLRGYREAITAQCDWILEIDAGFSHNPREIQKLIEKMKEGYDCIFGSRFQLGGSMESSIKRKIISRGGTILTNLLLGTKLKDMTSGFELFSRQALQSVLNKGLHSKGHFFQTEIKIHCRKFNIAEVPIHYQNPSNSVNNTILKDAFKNLWRLFWLRVSGRL